MEQIHAIFSNCFAELDEVVPISLLADKVTDGVHNTVIDEPGSGYFLLSCKNLKAGQLVIGDDEREIGSETFWKLRKRTRLSKGDILIASVGTIGELVLLDEEPKNIEFQRSVAIIKPNQNIISSYYLYEALLSRKEGLINKAHGAVQQCLFISDIASFEIPKPTSQESLEGFDSTVKPLFEMIRQNKKEILRLQSLRNSLLPKLIFGKIDVEDIEI